MTKPVFGKWTSVEDALPDFEKQAGEIEFVFVLALQKVGRVSEMEYNSKEGWRDCGYPICDNDVTHWMPLPKAGEDAFTELRARLDCMEHRSWHESFCGEEIPALKEVVLDLIREIREVIGE